MSIQNSDRLYEAIRKEAQKELLEELKEHISKDSRNTMEDSVHKWVDEKLSEN